MHLLLLENWEDADNFLNFNKLAAAYGQDARVLLLLLQPASLSMQQSRNVRHKYSTLKNLVLKGIISAASP